VRTDGRVAYCTSCLPQQGWTRRMELDLPAPVIAYLRQNGVALRVPPPHEPSCTRIFTTGDVRITSPVHGNEYMLETASETRLRCVATVPSDATTLYWYLDDVFVTSAPAGGDVFIVPERGEHTIDCVDDRGRRARATFIVRRW
jgi:penicillin-binding protein 1C